MRTRSLYLTLVFLGFTFVSVRLLVTPSSEQTAFLSQLNQQDCQLDGFGVCGGYCDPSQPGALGCVWDSQTDSCRCVERAYRCVWDGFFNQCASWKRCPNPNHECFHKGFMTCECAPAPAPPPPPPPTPCGNTAGVCSGDCPFGQMCLAAGETCQCIQTETYCGFHSPDNNTSVDECSPGRCTIIGEECKTVGDSCLCGPVDEESGGEDAGTEGGDTSGSGGNDSGGNDSGGGGGGCSLNEDTGMCGGTCDQPNYTCLYYPHPLGGVCTCMDTPNVCENRSVACSIGRCDHEDEICASNGSTCGCIVDTDSDDDGDGSGSAGGTTTGGAGSTTGGGGGGCSLNEDTGMCGGTCDQPNYTCLYYPHPLGGVCTCMDTPNVCENRSVACSIGRCDHEDEICASNGSTCGCIVDTDSDDDGDGSGSAGGTTTGGAGSTTGGGGGGSNMVDLCSQPENQAPERRQPQTTPPEKVTPPSGCPRVSRSTIDPDANPRTDNAYEEDTVVRIPEEGKVQLELSLADIADADGSIILTDAGMYGFSWSCWYDADPDDDEGPRDTCADALSGDGPVHITIERTGTFCPDCEGVLSIEYLGDMNTDDEGCQNYSLQDVIVMTGNPCAPENAGGGTPGGGGDGGTTTGGGGGGAVAGGGGTTTGGGGGNTPPSAFPNTGCSAPGACAPPSTPPGPVLLPPPEEDNFVHIDIFPRITAKGSSDADALAKVFDKIREDGIGDQCVEYTQGRTVNRNGKTLGSCALPERSQQVVCVGMSLLGRSQEVRLSCEVICECEFGS